MRATPANRAAKPFPIPIKVSHYENIEQVFWHFQADIAAIDDPAFASPLIAKDTQVQPSGWRYRLEQTDADDGRFLAIQASGVGTSRALAQPDGTVASVVCMVSDQIDLKKLASGKAYWVRTRQHNGNDSTWGNYLTSNIVVP